MSSSETETPTGGANPAQVQEVADIKEQYGADCKVSTDIGDYAHVIEVKLPRHKGVHIAFQLEDTYPKTEAHVIVKSRRLSNEDIETLALHLASFSEKRRGASMKLIIKHASKWLDALKPATDSSDEWIYSEDPKKVGYKPQRKETSKTRLRKKQEEQVLEEGKDKKKPAMKTAMDVASRVLWDESLKQEDFVIGYLDRILGVIEKDFGAFSWEDIASVDYNTLAIPKHRIQYYKYKGVVVWDKRIRLDNVFGSTGGKTITDVIAKYNEAHQVENNAQENQGLDHDNDTDEDDDGIEIDTGNCGAENFDKEDNYEEEAEAQLDEPWKARDDYWGPKKRPTHFLALRITNPDVIAAVANVHEVILNLDSSYDDCIIPTDRLHVTLACLGLDTQKDVDNAVNVLEELKQELASNWSPEKISINFNDVGNFFHSVLYAHIEHNEEFMQFAGHVRAAMQTGNVALRDVFEFTPHMTLIKLKRQLGREVLHTRYLDQRFYTELNGCHFGLQNVDNIYLCDMSEMRQEDGFYLSPTHISFP